MNLYFCKNCTSGQSVGCRYSIFKDWYDEIWAMCNRGQRINVNLYSDLKKIDRRELYIYFQKNFGIYPSQFIHKVRSNKVIDIIFENAEHKNNEIIISEEIGLDNVQTLDRILRVQLKMTFSQVRALLKSAENSAQVREDLRARLWEIEANCPKNGKIKH